MFFDILKSSEKWPAVSSPEFGWGSALAGHYLLWKPRFPQATTPKVHTHSDMLPDTLILQAPAPAMDPAPATTNVANESPTAGNGNGMFCQLSSLHGPILTLMLLQFVRIAPRPPTIPRPVVQTSRHQRRTNQDPMFVGLARAPLLDSSI